MLTESFSGRSRREARPPANFALTATTVSDLDTLIWINRAAAQWSILSRNPVSQAELLNRAGCEFNIMLGLCVGHDSLFSLHSYGLVTTLVAKDRVLAHNPIGALHLADSYYSRVWGPQRPDKPPKLPKEGRKPRRSP